MAFGDVTQKWLKEKAAAELGAVADREGDIVEGPVEASGGPPAPSMAAVVLVTVPE